MHLVTVEIRGKGPNETRANAKKVQLNYCLYCASDWFKQQILRNLRKVACILILCFLTCVTAIRRRSSWISNQLNGRNTRLRKKYRSTDFIYTFEVSVYILKPCREIGKSFEESLREGKLLNNLEIFLNEQWNSYWIRLSYDVKNYADLRGCYPLRPRWITSSEICIVFTSY